jgi:hypothetical protein
MNVVLAAILLSTCAQVDQTRIDGAVRKGVSFLKTAKTPAVGFAKIDDTFEIVLLTFVHAGVPETDEKFQEYLKKLLEQPLDRTYSVVLQAMILEELDRVKHQPRIAQCAQFLVDNQCANGQWSYGEPSANVKDLPPSKDVASAPAQPRAGAREFGAPGKKEKPKVRSKITVKKMKDGPATGDNSNSQYAALGLRACHDAGIVLPADVVQHARKWWIESQHGSDGEKGVATGGEIAAPPRGWCYSKQMVCDKKHHPYASMTAGAVGALAIYDFILDLDRKKDQPLRSGLAWLNAHWSVTGNEGPAEFSATPAAEYYYFLYALEQAGMLLDLPAIRKLGQYPRARKAVEDQKGDGSWVAGGGSQFVGHLLRDSLPEKATQRLESRARTRRLDEERGPRPDPDRRELSGAGVGPQGRRVLREEDPPRPDGEVPLLPQRPGGEAQGQPLPRHARRAPEGRRHRARDRRVRSAEEPADEAVTGSTRPQDAPKKLAAEQIADLEAWIQQGAPWPPSSKPTWRAKPKKQIRMSIEEGRKFWAFRPVAKPAVPAVKDARGRRRPRPASSWRRWRRNAPSAPPARSPCCFVGSFRPHQSPPSPRSRRRFLKDGPPDAVAGRRRLLASPLYGSGRAATGSTSPATPSRSRSAASS